MKKPKKLQTKNHGARYQATVQTNNSHIASNKETPFIFSPLSRLDFSHSELAYIVKWDLLRRVSMANAQYQTFVGDIRDDGLI